MIFKNKKKYRNISTFLKEFSTMDSKENINKILDQDNTIENSIINKLTLLLNIIDVWRNSGDTY